MRLHWLCAFLTFFLASVAYADEAKTPGGIRATLLTDDLNHPVQITSAPGEPARLYIAERGGIVRILENGKLLSEEVLDISTVVHKKHPHGLLGIAFAPDYKNSRIFYAAYIDPQGDVNVGRFRHASEDVADEDSMTVIIKLAQAFPNTHGAAIGFGPDGYLYLSWGDGGGPTENLESTQRLSSLFGKVLRIDVSHEGKYSIPADNPFFNQPKALGEVWALGFRNPRHLSFDRLRGDLLVIDEGARLTEVNKIERGKNYGWSVMEGTGCIATPCALPSATSPLFTVSTTEAFVGGFVYHGSRLPDLEGAYIFADSASGEVFASTPRDGTWDTRRIYSLPKKSISTIGESSSGEILIGTLAGELLTLEKPLSAS